MKKQLSSLDLHFLVKELKDLENSRIDKIYQPEKNVIIFSLYKSNVGKKILKIDVGKSMFIADEKEEGETLGFGMFLRKHLDGYFLSRISQVEPERILKFSFKVKNNIKDFYIEFFGKGNAILCYDDIILNALDHHEFRDRTIKPKIKYKFPLMKHNYFQLSTNELKELLKNSKKNSIVTSLAIELGFGGIYSEEICLISDVDKGTDPKKLSDEEIGSISDNIKKIINKEIKPSVIYKDGDIADFAAFDLKFYSKNEKKEFKSFSEALSFFYSQFVEVKETEFDKRLRGLQRIIESQKKTIEEFRSKEKESREKGELIYHKYNTIKEILDELTNASKKYSWKEIKSKLKGHKVIKEVNDKDRKVVVEV